MRLLTHNLGLKLLALAMASSISAYVYYEINYPVPDVLYLPLRVRALGPDLILAEPLPERVAVHVRGPYRGIRRLKSLSPPAFVSLGDVTEPAVQRVPIQVPDLGEVVATSVAPETVMASVDRKLVTRYTLAVDRRGQLDPRFTVADERWNASSIKVWGPQAVVARINRVQIEPNLTRFNTTSGDVTRPLVSKLNVYAYDDAGQRINSEVLSLEPSVVEYSASLAPAGSLRILKVIAEHAGQPAPEHILVGLTPSPLYVAVPAELVDKGVATVRTHPISLSGRRESFVAQTAIEYPFERAEGSDLPTEASVTVEITSLAEDALGAMRVPVQLAGESSRFDYVLDPPQVKVLSDDFAALAAEARAEVRARLDVAGLGAGEYRLAPQVSLPPELDSVRIVPTSVTLTIIEHGK